MATSAFLGNYRKWWDFTANDDALEVIVIVDGTAKKELWLGEMNIP